MATPVIREVVGGTGGAPNGATVTTSANVKAGDLLLAFHAIDWGASSSNAFTTTPSPGTWAQVATDTRTDQPDAHIRLYSRFVTAGGAQTITFPSNGSSADVAATLVVIDGESIDPDDWLDAAADGGSATTATAHVAPGVDPTSADALLLAGFATSDRNGPAPTYTAGPTGMTLAPEGDRFTTYVRSAVYQQTLTSGAATGDRTATASKARVYGTVTVAIKGVEPPPDPEGLLWAADYAAVRTPAGYGFTNVQYQADGQNIVNNYTGSAIAGASHPSLGNSLYLTLNPDEGRIEATPPGGVSYFGEGDDAFFRFDFVLDSNFEVNATNRHHALSQIHSASSTASPPLEFDVVDGGLYTRGASDAPEYNLLYRRLCDVAVGVKYSVIFRVKFSFTAANGLVEVWVNGAKVLSEVPTHAMLNGGGDSYWKGATFYRSSAYTSTEGQWQSNHAIATTYDALANLDNGNNAAYGDGEEPLPTTPPTTTDALQQRTVNELADWHSWLIANNAQGFVGEYATVTKWADYGDAGQQAKWDALAEVYLDYADYARIHTAYWSSGREFDAGYPLGLQVPATQNQQLTVAHGTGATIAAHPSRHGVIRAVNLAGHENGVTINGGGPVRSGAGFVHTAADFAFLAANGVDTVRLCGAWERLQPTLGQALSSTALAAVDGMLTAARNNGIQVIADPLHNYGRYTQADGTVVSLGAGISNAQFSDFWTRFSAWVRADTARSGTVLAYGLMNEPHDLTGGATTWEASSQAALTAIRGGGDNRLVFVAGYTFSSLYEWRTWHPDGWITDPAGNFAYEAHHYWDSQTVNADGTPSPRSGQFQQPNGAGGHETMAYATELAAANAELYRVNLCINPSVETNLDGYNAPAVTGTLSATLARFRGNVTSPTPPAGAYYLYSRPDNDGTSGYMYQRVPRISVTSGEGYTFSAYRYINGTLAWTFVGLDWFNSAGAQIGSSPTSPNITGAGWARGSVTAVAPAGAVQAQPFLAQGVVDYNNYARWDALLFEKTDELKPYFDGDTVGASWDGTAHASTSRILDVAPAQDYVQTVTDTAGVADTATRVVVASPTLVDTAPAGDMVDRVGVHAPTVLDTAGLADDVTGDEGYERWQVDPVGVVDTASRVVQGVREQADPAPLADELDVNVHRTGEAADTVELADETSYLLGTDVRASDAEPVDDTVEVEAQYVPEHHDTALLADSRERVAGYDREYADGFGVDDELTAVRGQYAELTDDIGVADGLSATVDLGAIITDTLPADDTTSLVAPATRGILDKAPVLDSVDVTTRGRVTQAAPVAVEYDVATDLPPSVSTPAPRADEHDIACTADKVTSRGAPGPAVESDTAWTPRPTGSWPTEQAGEWDVTFPAIVLVDDGEFALAINDEDRTPTYVLKADWNRNGLFDHPLSDLTGLVEEVSVSKALQGTLPAEVGLVEGYSTAELSVTLSGEISAIFQELEERRNLVINPSFESHTQGWTGNGESTTLSREQGAVINSGPITPRSGSWYAYTRRSTTGDLTVYPTALSPVTPGQNYTGSIFINRDGANEIRLDLDWYNSSGAYLSSTLGALNTPPVEVWTQLMTTGTAPTGATQARIFVRFINQTGGWYVRLDSALFERVTSVLAGQFFDGNSPGARWVGTVNNSVSIREGVEGAALAATGREFDVVDAFAPYRRDSPLYGRPVLQTPIYLETGFLADDGPRLARRFTGTVTRIHPESAARTVQLSAMDPVNRLRATLTLPAVAMYESILARRGPDQYRSRFNSQWLIDYALRRNGIYTSPPCRENAILSVTMHGSWIPEIGWGGAPEGYQLTYRGENWQQGKFGGALCPRVGSLGRWWLTEQVTAASGTGFGFSQWMVLQPVGSSAVGEYFSLDLTTNASWFINFGIGADGRPYLESRNVGGSTVRATPGGFSPPTGGGYFYFVGVHVSFAATQMTVRFRINQTTYTSTVTIGSRPGNWKPGIYMNYSYNTQFQNFQMWKSASVPVTPWQGEDPNWVPQADLDPGVNELTGIPELRGEDSWELIKEVVEAEGSTFQFDEYGRPQFITSKGDQWYGRTKAVKEVVSADRNLADLVSTTDETTIRNVINIKTKTLLVSDWQPYYEATDIHEFDVPAASTSYFELNTSGSVYEIPPPLSTFGCRPSGPNCYAYAGGTGFIFFWADDDWSGWNKLDYLKSFIRAQAVFNDDPVTSVGEKIQIRAVRLTPWKMQLIINNQWPDRPIRFSTRRTLDGEGRVSSEGQPSLIIPARSVIEGPDQVETYTDNASVAAYGASPFDVGGNADRWRQTPYGFRSVATDVLATTASPVPVLDAVSVPHDPRRKLADRLVLRDPDGLGEVTASIVGLVQTFSSSGASDQLTVRPIGPPT